MPDSTSSKLTIERLFNGEPILSPTANWWESGVTFNAAAVYVKPGAENRNTIRALLPMRDPSEPELANGVIAIHYRARPEVDSTSSFPRSFIGLAVFTPDLRLLYRYQEPVLYPSVEPGSYDIYGVEDPRITLLEARYYMVYCGVEAVLENGWKTSLCLAVSDDLLHWQKLGVMPGDITQYNNKDGVLFPDRIDGWFYLLHRPFANGWPHSDYAMRLARSETLSGPWQDCGEILRAAPNPRMRSSWVGAGSVPILAGGRRYIEIYHTGNEVNEIDREYDLDAALLDFDAYDPVHPQSLVTARLEHFMMPETEAELRSRSVLQVANVLFACGSYEYQEDIYIIYGGADTYTLAARVPKKSLLEALAAMKGE